MQTRDAVQVISLPKVSNRAICPFRALKALKKYYPMTATHSAFQINISGGWQPLTDSRVRKALKSINMTLGLDPAFFTYHSFRRSGATFAYNAHVSRYNTMAHGPLNVSGGTFSRTMCQEKL